MPNFTLRISIDGLNAISECDNIELKAILLIQCLYPIVFKWDISYVYTSPEFSNSAKQKGEEYFRTFSNFSSASAISIPNKYYTYGCIIAINLTARTNLGLENASFSTQIEIKPALPTVKFTSKMSDYLAISSSATSIIPFYVSNQKCNSSNNRLLESSSIIEIKIDFELYSGRNPNTIATRGDIEIQIEKEISSLFNKYQTLSLSFGKGFKYNTYYNLKAIVTDVKKNTATSDFILFAFFKPPITCIIDPIGSIVSVTKDIIINGGNSIIPLRDGDNIEFIWKCISATSYSNVTTCVCPVLLSHNLESTQVTIAESKLQNLCKYQLSLTITATGSSSYIRTSTKQIEFLAYKKPILPVKGKTIDGYLQNVRDIYFTSELTSNGSDSNLTYEWTLVEIESLDPLYPVKFSQINTFTYNFFKRIGMESENSKIIGDIEIPHRYIPTYLTNTNERIIGLDIRTMIANTRYIYAVIVNYPDTPSFEFISYDVPPKPRERMLLVSPMNGIGMETQFSVMYHLAKTTDVDLAQYQILRKDCPSSNSSATPVTELSYTLSSFTGYFSPGLKSCDFQVDIILRVVEYGSAIEIKQSVTIKNSQKTATELVASSLNALSSNDNYTTPSQKISILNEISNINDTEASEGGKNSVNKIIKVISQIDSAAGGVRDLMDGTQVTYLLNATASTLGKVLTTQVANAEPSTALNVSSKMSNYMNDVDSIPGGSRIIPTCVSTLSAVADVGNVSNSDNKFYEEVQKVINQVPDLKLKEIVAGAPAYSLSFPQIELVMKNDYLSSFDSSKETETGKGSKMQLPENLMNAIKDEISNTSINMDNTLTIGTTLNAVLFNPYNNIKTNANIDIESISNILSSIATPEMIAQIYKDLNKGRLENVVNTKRQNSDILQAMFNSMEILKNGDTQKSNNTFLLGKLADNKRVNFTFPMKGDQNTSQSIPLYYTQDKKWENKGCDIVPSNDTEKAIASCNTLGKEQKSPDKEKGKPSLKLAVDLIENLDAVLKAGNYEMLYNFDAFFSASWEGYSVICGEFIFLVFIGYLAWYFNKYDDFPLFEQRIDTLYQKYGTDKEEEANGILKKVYVFYSEVRKKGMSKIAEEAQATNEVETNRNLKSNEKEKEKEEKILPNGFSVLTEYENKDLRDQYYFFAEHLLLFSNKYLYIKCGVAVCSDPILRRLTQAGLADEIITKPITFCSILKVRLLMSYYVERAYICKRNIPT